MTRQVKLILEANQQKTLPVFLQAGEETKVEAHLADNSYLKLLALFFGSNRQSYSLQTDIFHEGLYSKSETVVKGVLTELAQGRVLGKVNIKKGAKGSHASLSGKILLFDEAKVLDAAPVLEIDENEVCASHDMAIGRIDDNSLFYLQSRGLEYKKAKRLIIEGFFASTWSTLGNQEGKWLEKFWQQVAHVIGKGGG